MTNLTPKAVKAAQWVTNNPHAHPTNMVAVCRAAVEGE
jgi:hypothetical protein